MTQWRQRTRSSLPLSADGTRAGDHAVWQLASYDGEPAEDAPQEAPAPQVQLRRAGKRKALDLENLENTGMFGELVAQEPDAPRPGQAQLVFLSSTEFVGLVQLAGSSGVVRLSGSENTRECDRELCGADECCGDMVFNIRVADEHAQRSFMACSTGLGDYAAFQGPGISFEAESVPTGAERERGLERFALPADVRRDAVLCHGIVQLEWDDYGSDGDGSGSGDLILPAIEAVAIPKRSEPLSLACLVAAGGTPVDPNDARFSFDDDDF